MAFGSNDFPLGGPAGGYPKQRVSNYGNYIAPPNRVEDVYRGNDSAQLPVVEREFSSSVEKVKRRLKMGRKRDMIAGDDFYPRYKKDKLNKKPWKR